LNGLTNTYFNTNSNSSYSLYVSAYIVGADIPGLQSVETTIPGVPMLLSVRSLDDLEQGSADRQSTISTNIYRSSSDENSCM
jgi:hypothetical protein